MLNQLEVIQSLMWTIVRASVSSMKIFTDENQYENIDENMKISLLIFTDTDRTQKSIIAMAWIVWLF